jgi:hypothetical protein
VTILYSSSRHQEARKLTDVYLNPPLERVGMLDWSRFDSIVQQGRTHAEDVLDKLPAEKLEALQGHQHRPAPTPSALVLPTPLAGEGRGEGRGDAQAPPSPHPTPARGRGSFSSAADS